MDSVVEADSVVETDSVVEAEVAMDVEVLAEVVRIFCFSTHPADHRTCFEAIYRTLADM